MGYITVGVLRGRHLRLNKTSANSHVWSYGTASVLMERFGSEYQMTANGIFTWRRFLTRPPTNGKTADPHLTLVIPIPDYMNVICLILLVVFPVWTLAARQPAGISDLAKLPVEQAEHLLNNSEGSQIHFDMVSAALSSRRMDLIQMCFENQYTQVILSNAVAELQDNDFQDRIVLMMLKSDSLLLWMVSR